MDNAVAGAQRNRQIAGEKSVVEKGLLDDVVPVAEGMMISLKPKCAYVFMMCQRIGKPPTVPIGFGFALVSSDSRVPKPPARMTIFSSEVSSSKPRKVYPAPDGRCFVRGTGGKRCRTATL